MSTQIAGAKPGDGPFAAREGEEEPVVGIEEEVEAAEGAALGFVPLLRFLWVEGSLLPSLLTKIPVVFAPQAFSGSDGGGAAQWGQRVMGWSAPLLQRAQSGHNERCQQASSTRGSGADL